MFLGRDLKWWKEWSFGYLLMLPLFALGVYLSIILGLGLGLGMFVGAGFGCAPMFGRIYLEQRAEKKPKQEPRD